LLVLAEWDWGGIREGDWGDLINGVSLGILEKLQASSFMLKVLQVVGRHQQTRVLLDVSSGAGCSLPECRLCPGAFP